MQNNESSLVGSESGNAALSNFEIPDDFFQFVEDFNTPEEYIMSGHVDNNFIFRTQFILDLKSQ